MALSLLQSLSKKRVSVSICQLINRSLLSSNQRRVHRVDMYTRFTYANPQNYGWQVRLPLMGVRWHMSSGPWSLAAKKKPPPLEDDMGGEGPHTTVWASERLTGIILMTLFPLDLLVPSSVFEVAISICAVLHNHWGFETICSDYFRVATVGRLVNKAAQVAVYGLSVIMLVGLMQLIFTGPGIAETIKMFWGLSGN